MAKSCPTVAKSQVQTVFAVLEDVTGELQKPTAEGFITPAGRATMTQTPGYSDSEELSPSLNPINQFQDAVEAGEGSIPMYLRLQRGYAKPQGDALFVALMGDYNAPTLISAVVDSTSGVLETDVDIPISGITNSNAIDKNILKGKFPPRGVVKIGSENILYQTVEYADAGKATLKNCQRGYANTTAAEHDDAAAVQMLSRVYTQSVCRPTVSVWIMDDDKILRFMSGCGVTQKELSLQKQQGQKITFNFQGRRLGWCGVGELAEDPVGAKVKLVEGGADAYTVGGYVRNRTKADDNAGAGYRVLGVDDVNDTLTLSYTPTGWKSGDELYPFLPTAQSIGIAVESRTANVMIDKKIGKMNEGGLTYQSPIVFLSEIGDMYPGEGVDTKRTMTLNRSINFRAKDGAEFGRGYRGYELPVTVFAGKDPELTLAFFMPRVKFNTPEIGENDSVITLTQDGAALGVAGEDAYYIIQE